MRFLDAFLQALRLFPLFLSMEAVASPKPLCWKTSTSFSIVAASQNQVKMSMGTSCFWAWHLPKSLVQFSMPSGHKRSACYRSPSEAGLEGARVVLYPGPWGSEFRFLGGCWTGSYRRISSLHLCSPVRLLQGFMLRCPHVGFATTGGAVAFCLSLAPVLSSAE